MALTMTNTPVDRDFTKAYRALAREAFRLRLQTRRNPVTPLALRKLARNVARSYISMDEAKDQILILHMEAWLQAVDA